MDITVGDDFLIVSDQKIFVINLRQWPTWYTIALFYNTFIM